MRGRDPAGCCFLCRVGFVVTFPLRAVGTWKDSEQHLAQSGCVSVLGLLEQYHKQGLN